DTDHHGPAFGHTPPGAGKTCLPPPTRPPPRKHPHRRGEDSSTTTQSKGEPETPPQAWGRRGHTEMLCDIDGNTPTGVGKTGLCTGHRLVGWKHPHRRGEDGAPRAARADRRKTPPQASGTPVPLSD